MGAAIRPSSAAQPIYRNHTACPGDGEHSCSRRATSGRQGGMDEDQLAFGTAHRRCHRDLFQPRDPRHGLHAGVPPRYAVFMDSVHKSPVILVVDDSKSIRTVIEVCLTGIECEIRFASNGVSALAMIEADPPDLVLLDVNMPGMDGYEVCRRIRADSRLRLLPVVMITARSHRHDRVKALEYGADDFMTKPFERAELVARVRSSLRLKSLYNTLDSAEQVIFALAAAVEAKDSVTERHTRRVAESARHLGMRLGLPEQALDALYRGGIIHDIGKIGVSEAILLKGGPLDNVEQRSMQAHPDIGANIIAPLQAGAGTQWDPSLVELFLAEMPLIERMGAA